MNRKILIITLLALLSFFFCFFFRSNEVLNSDVSDSKTGEVVEYDDGIADVTTDEIPGTDKSDAHGNSSEASSSNVGNSSKSSSSGSSSVSFDSSETGSSSQSTDSGTGSSSDPEIYDDNPFNLDKDGDGFVDGWY